MKVSTYVSGAVRQFSYWFAHGTLGYPLLEGIEYTGEILREESSFAEQAFAIFMNNPELDGDGSVLNYRYRGHRAAQYIRHDFDADYADYKVEPPFDSWETELHAASKDSS